MHRVQRTLELGPSDVYVSGMKQIVIAGNTLVVVFVNSFRLGSIITSGRAFG